MINPNLESESISSDKAQNICALLVDDDEVYLKVLSRILAKDVKYTYKLLLASTGAEAIVSIESDLRNIDIIIMDFNLPDMSGVDCVSKFRENRQSEENLPPVIICTAEGNEDTATAAIRAEADDYLPKREINANSLTRAIHNVVEKHRLRCSIETHYSEVNILNERLEKQNFEIKQFYHNISHEVKTPLAAAREFVSLVRDGVPGPINEDQAKVLDMALTSCDNIGQHFKDLVDITRLELKGLKLNTENSCIETIVSRSVAACADQVRERGGALNVHLEKGLADTINVDENRIVQVLTNLVSNAVKYSGEKLAIDVSVKIHSGKDVCFSVADNGLGIDKENHEMIFERLGQSHEAHSECLGAGLGLGLTIAREIVELHGGKIWLDSELGSGSTFYFSVPQK